MNYFDPFQQNYNNIYSSYNTVPQVVKVNGYNGANAYQLPPNASALLLDETQPIVWLVKTDGAGYKSITPFDITEHKETDAMKSIEERLSRLEKLYDEQSNSKQTESTAE